MSEASSRSRFLKFTFFAVDRDWRRLEALKKEVDKKEFLAALGEFEGRMMLRYYSLVGLKKGADLMIRALSSRLEDFQEITTQILKTAMGPYLDITHSFLAMLRPSEYQRGDVHEGGEALGRHAKEYKYLFFYPLSKKRSWYRLPFEERLRMMQDHFRIGHRHPSIKINTAYSFGLDDHEFALSFETDHPSDFLELVLELRSSEASQYTKSETPIFTCLATTAGMMLDNLG